MPPLLGVYVFTDRLAFAAADWCLRLHGWPIMPPLLGVYVFTAGLPCRRRLVSSPTRLAYYAAVVGCLCLHRLAASYDANWSYRLHGWPPRCHHSTSSIADWLCRRRLVFLSSQLRVFATDLLLLLPTHLHFITAMQLYHHYGATSSLLSSAQANSIASTLQDLLFHQPRRLQEL
jgi:hypothetical protein